MDKTADKSISKNMKIKKIKNKDIIKKTRDDFDYQKTSRISHGLNYDGNSVKVDNYFLTKTVLTNEN